MDSLKSQWYGILRSDVLFTLSKVMTAVFKLNPKTMNVGFRRVIFVEG